MARRKVKRFKPTPENIHKYNLVVKGNEKIYIRKDVQGDYVRAGFDKEITFVGPDCDKNVGDSVNNEDNL